MKPWEQHTYALMRIVVGAVFLWHGSQKLFGYPPLPPGIEIPGFVTWVGGSVEFFGGILVMLGLFTRWAAFISSGQMAVAYWMAHGTKHWLPQINGGELAVIYCFVFLYIASRGAGIWSVDAARGA